VPRVWGWVDVWVVLCVVVMTGCFLRKGLVVVSGVRGRG